MATKTITITDVQVTTNVSDSQSRKRGTPDPYLVFHSQRSIYGSRRDHKKNDKMPSWVGPYVIGLNGPRETEQIRVELWDYDRGGGSRDDRMEEAIIVLDNERSEGKKTWPLSAGGKITFNWKVTGRSDSLVSVPVAAPPKEAPVVPGMIRITRLTCTDLLPRDGRRGVVDPYVLITGVSTNFQERWETQKNKADPVWDAQVDINYDPEGYRIEVWDADTTGGDDLCGEGILRVANNGKGEARVNLMLGWKGREIKGGQLVIRMDAVQHSVAPGMPVIILDPNVVPPTPEGPLTRYEIRKMPAAAQQRFVNALLKLFESPNGPQTSEYFRIAGYHGWPSDFCQHGQETFPGWHRGYLAELERAIIKADKELGNDGKGIGLPYWDWTQEIDGQMVPKIIRDNFPELPEGFLNASEAGALGEKGIKGLYSDAKIKHNIDKARVAFQAEQCLTHSEHWMHASTRFNRQGYSLESPHNSIHMACGFPMTSIYYAAFHPIFFLHHCNVDRIYEKHVLMETRNECTTEFGNRQRQLSRQGEVNRYNKPLEPFRHPFEDRPLMPTDTFNTMNMGYVYDELPPNPTLMMREAPVFAAFVKVNVMSMKGKSYMLYAFVMTKEEADAWAIEPGTPIEQWCDHPNYGGTAAIFSGKGKDCENCKSRPPFTVLIEVQDALKRLGLSRHKAAIRVMCEDEFGDIFLLEDTSVPQPSLVGPLFEDLAGSQGSSGDAWEAGNEEGDVAGLQRMLKTLGHEPGNSDGKFGPKTETALRSLQKFLGLTDDGVAGPLTKNTIMKSRKDLHPDVETADAKTDAQVYRFVAGSTLLWSLGPMPGYMHNDNTHACIAKACTAWGEAMGITFKWTGSGLKADIHICWDDLTMNGESLAGGVSQPGGQLAEATPQKLSLDSGERWLLAGEKVNQKRDGCSKGVMLYDVLLHELGHCLGLVHSSNPKDVMWPYYDSDSADAQVEPTLSDNDKARARAQVAPNAPAELSHIPHLAPGRSKNDDPVKEEPVDPNRPAAGAHKGESSACCSLC